MRKGQRKISSKRAAAGVVMICVVLAVLTGCGKGNYEKISEAAAETALETATEGTALETAAAGTALETAAETAAEIALETAAIEIVLEKAEEKADAADIVIETGDGDTAESSNAAEIGDQGIHLLFAGDVLLSDHVLRAYENAGGIEGVLDEGYRRVIADADFFFANEEFPFSNRGSQAPDKQFTFRLPPEKVHLLWQMGIDGVSLANNHALDYGTDALLDSCEVLDNAGIGRTGAGADLNEAKQAVTVEISGKRIAIIGATRVIPVAEWAAGAKHPGMLATYDPTVLLEEIRRLRQENDYVIVYVHWGIERDETPQEYQRSLGKQYIDAGADLVIGAHPHVLQGLEYYKGKAIVYSLGNFVFGSSIPRTALLQVTEDLTLRLIPGTSSAGYTRRITDPEKCREFYQYMEGISFGVRFQEDGTVICE